MKDATCNQKSVVVKDDSRDALHRIQVSYCSLVSCGTIVEDRCVSKLDKVMRKIEDLQKLDEFTHSQSPLSI